MSTLAKYPSIRKICIMGASGMLGRYIYTYFSRISHVEVIVIPFRVTSKTLDDLEYLLINNNIDRNTCLINCIGQIPQRKSADSSDHVYFLTNSIFPHLLWSICNRYGAKMIQPATDCVFSGKIKNNTIVDDMGEIVGGKYLETDLHDEINSYGMSKSLGEPLGCTVIRTSIIGRELANKKSFLEWVLSNGPGSKIQGWKNHQWNGITCLEYCKLLDAIFCTDGFWSGVRHIYSPTIKSKYDLACMIVDAFGLEDVEVQGVVASEPIYKTLASLYPVTFEIAELFDQIVELTKFNLDNI